MCATSWGAGILFNMLFSSVRSFSYFLIGEYVHQLSCDTGRMQPVLMDQIKTYKVQPENRNNTRFKKSCLMPKRLFTSRPSPSCSCQVSPRQSAKLLSTWLHALVLECQPQHASFQSHLFVYLAFWKSLLQRCWLQHVLWWNFMVRRTARVLNQAKPWRETSGHS